MQAEGDRDALRFRLDWPEDDLGVAPEETDFSFDWGDQRDEGPPLAGVTIDEPEEIAEFAQPEPDPYAGLPEPVSVLDDDVDLAAAGEVYEVPFYTDTEAIESVRAVLDEHNDALVQLSDAVLDLANNVGLLIQEIRSGTSTPGDTGSVAASAMVTLTSEVGGAVAALGETREEIRGLMDDLVAAAGGDGPTARLGVEIDRLRAEVQALKRRLPVRAKELDVDDLVERVAGAVVDALGGERAAPAPQPVQRVRRRPVRAVPVPEPAPAEEPPRAKRRRPLRAD